jgi:predicted component of type VI protein secretion system
MTPPTARLEVVAGRAVGMSVLIDDELLIGRHADGAGRLADDEEISRSHARITLDRTGFCAIEDLGSTNGTFVNGLRISGPQTMSVGDTVEVGGTTLVVRELPIPATERSFKAGRPQPTMAPGTSHPSARARSASQETPRIGDSSRPGRDLPAEDTTEAPPGKDPARTSLSLTVNVDFAAREATVELDESSEPIRLVFDGETWRPA